MTKQDELEIYKAILGTAEKTSALLREIAEKVKALSALYETFYRSIYEHNQNAKLTAANAAFNPNIPKKAGDETSKRIDASLQDIQKGIYVANREILKIKEQIKLMKEGTNDPANQKTKAAQEQLLNDVNELDKKSQDISTYLNLIMKSSTATPDQRKFLASQLEPLSEQVLELKKAALKKADQHVPGHKSPKPGRI